MKSKITVIVPTYRRPDELTNCLTGLQHQNRLADEVIVTVRDIDSETQHFFESYPVEALPLKIVTVTTTGVVAAMNAGLQKSEGDIIVFTDDDAIPKSNWLQLIEDAFLADDKVGGVGGKDWVYDNGKLKEGQEETVGKIQWFGRAIGNHALGFGAAREVDILKGVNMSFRREAIAGLQFDHRMWGTGAQVHFEMAFCFALKKRGWKLIYDPNIAVDHHHAQRFDEDQRKRFNQTALINQVHNETLIMLENLEPIRRLFYLLWALVLGSRAERGFVQGVRFLPLEGFLAFQKVIAAFQGRLAGVNSWRETSI